VTVKQARDAMSPSWPLVVGAVALIAYAWVVAGLRPFTDPENVVVAVPIVVVAVLAARRGRADSHPPARSNPAPHGAVVWLGLAGAVAAWELAALFSSPRDDHPTMSSIADWIMSVRVGRTFLVIVWLALGVMLAWRPSLRPRR
jgi:hypothetical protein